MSCLLISTGDPAGIGPEVCLQALAGLGALEGVRPVLAGDIGILRDAASLVGFSAPLRRIDSLAGAPPPGPGAEVLHVERSGPAPRGSVSPGAGAHSVRILEACSRRCLAGAAAGLVTAPINKASLRAAGHGGLGHTELLARLAGVERVETVFCLGRLKIFFLTRHLSLRQALERVRADAVLDALLRMHAAMRSLGVPRPRLGVPGLNPHCGDDGLFGTEEIDEIAPAVARARELGLDVRGPVGADSIFHLGLEGGFDAILSLYHDQGHIASKTRDFHGTVTMTLGLPYLRTSVDHGTGLDLAWRGIANPESMTRAVALAVELIRGTPVPGGPARERKGHVRDGLPGAPASREERGGGS